MAFNPNPPRADYQATAGQTNFPFLFKIYFTEDMNVYHTPISTNVPTKLIEGVDYSVVINGDEGGTVTLILVVENNDYIVLERELSLTRYVEYQTSGDLLAVTLNADQDYQTYLVSDQESKLSQAITIPPGVPGFNGELPAPIGEAYLRWAEDAKSLENDTTPPTWRNETLQYRNEAEAWAQNPEDVPVESGQYSAYHWAQKALKSEPINPDVATLKVEGEYVSPYHMKNKLINGGFDIWQRGTSFSAEGYGADRWYFSTVSNLVGEIYKYELVDIGQVNDYGGNTNLAILNVTTAPTSVVSLLEQRIENPYKLSGKTITVSFYARADSVNSNISVNLFSSTVKVNASNLNMNFTTSFAPNSTISRYSYTLTLPEFDSNTITVNDSIKLRFVIPSGFVCTTLSLTGIQLEEGSVATPFEVRPIGLELLLCKRYYVGKIVPCFIGTVSDYQFITTQQMGSMRATPSVSVIPDSGSGAVYVSSTTNDEITVWQTAGNSETAHGQIYLDAEL